MQKKGRSMKWKMIWILFGCWLVPLAVLICVFGIYMVNSHSNLTVQNFQSQMEFSCQICGERLDRAVTASRQASYDGEILKILKTYQQDQHNFSAAQKSLTDYLLRRYQDDMAVSSVIFWFEENDTIQSASLYSDKQNGSYQQIRRYWEEDHEYVAKTAANLDTAVMFLVRGNSLYLIRNLMDNHYVSQGVLVLCLNKEYCFNSLFEYPMQDGVCLWINDQTPLILGDGEANDWEQLFEQCYQKEYDWVDGQLCVTEVLKRSTYEIRGAMMIQNDISMFPFYGYPFVIIGMLLSLLLMLIVVWHAFQRQIHRPIQKLLEAGRVIEEGDLGYQISDAMPNREFMNLSDSFNHMSENLRMQFNKLYEEEIALREARIMALQSHINPHFLNNTMEIINWEARLEGNLKVSRMIEALSTMMDAAMDRRKRPEVSLAEEMGYVNSYLYIMQERLGKRLTVTIELSQELMSCMVPRLILQPVIENAIEHGVARKIQGKIEIKGYREGDYLYLEIWNDGGMREEDRSRIARLLDPDYDASREPAHNLGIANVNQRLRILFGAPCGLSVEEIDGKVRACLTIPWRFEQ